MVADPMSEVLSRLTNVSKHGNYWIASCPTRRDSNPSLSIRQGEKGVMLKDFGGSSLEEIVDAMGLTVGDLFYEDADAKREWVKDNVSLRRRSERKKEYKRPEVPQDATFREGSLHWFQQRGISPATMQHFRIYSAAEHFFSRKAKRNTQAICFPYFKGGIPINVKYRSVGLKINGVEVKDFTTEAGSEPIWYNLDNIPAEPNEVIIVEGEVDVLSLHEAGIGNAISPPNGCESIGEEVMESGAWFLTNDAVRIILAGDMDKSGQEMMDKLAARIGKERCSKVTWPEDCKDANDTLVRHGAAKVRECIADAEAIPVDGIIRVRDVMDAVWSLYRDGLPRGISTGIPSLDDHYTVKPGYWMAMTAAPGGGKSNLIDMIMTNMAERDGARFAVASFENRNIARHVANILPKRLRLPFGAGKSERMSEEQVHEAGLWMDRHFEFVQPPVPTLESVLTAAKSLVFSQGITGLVIDPWNRLHHPANGLTNGDYIVRCLDMIATFAYRHSVYIWLVAHPTKLVKGSNGQYPVPTQYDISGSAHFYNMEDFGGALWRDRDDMTKPVEFHMQKSRFQEIASEGVVRLGYDPITTRYYDLKADGSNQFDMWRPKNLLDRMYEAEEAFALETVEDERELIEAVADQKAAEASSPDDVLFTQSLFT